MTGHYAWIPITLGTRMTTIPIRAFWFPSGQSIFAEAWHQQQWIPKANNLCWRSWVLKQTCVRKPDSCVKPVSLQKKIKVPKCFRTTGFYFLYGPRSACRISLTPGCWKMEGSSASAKILGDWLIVFTCVFNDSKLKLYQYFYESRWSLFMCFFG